MDEISDVAVAADESFSATMGAELGALMEELRATLAGHPVVCG